MSFHVTAASKTIQLELVQQRHWQHEHTPAESRSSGYPVFIRLQYPKVNHITTATEESKCNISVSSCQLHDIGLLCLISRGYREWGQNHFIACGWLILASIHTGSLLTTFNRRKGMYLSKIKMFKPIPTLSPAQVHVMRSNEVLCQLIVALIWQETRSDTCTSYELRVSFKFQD